jgi:hypothetical protein
MLDDHDDSSAQLFGSTGRSPLDGLRAKAEFDDGVPFPDETDLQRPCTPVQRTPISSGEPENDETPDEFPGCGAGPKEDVPPSDPMRTPGAHNSLDRSNASEQTGGWTAPPPVASRTRSILQFYHDAIRRWSDLGEVGREGKILTRDTFRAWDANPGGLTEQHLRLGFEGDELYVEPFETLNGVYRKLRPNRPEELPPHTRFRIGRYFLEFRLADPAAEILPRRSSSGEVFQGRTLVPLGFLDVIGPDARTCLSFPLTKRGEFATCIGRTGLKCDIALTGDDWVSQVHARLWFKRGKCALEDVGSSNGTFLILNGRTPIRRGSSRDSAADELLVGDYKIRIIEEKA